MPRKGTNSPPPEVMTWGGALPVLVVAGLFDLIRMFFGMFWFFGPALAAVWCTVKATDIAGAAGTYIGGALCTGAATAAGAYLVGPLESLGVIMAEAVGLIALLVLGLWVAITNTRILKTVKNAPLQFAGAFAVGEIPLLGSLLPVFVVILWKLYKTQIKVEKAALKKWEKENAGAQLKEQQQQQAAQLMQNQAAEPTPADVY